MEYLDAVSVHPYREGLMSPETAIYDYKKLRGLIDTYSPTGKKNIPIINSEWGYSSNDFEISVRATCGICCKDAIGRFNQQHSFVRMVMIGKPR